MIYFIIITSIVVYLVLRPGFKRKKKVKNQVATFQRQFKIDPMNAERLFYTKVAGVSKKNNSGASRQKIIKNLDEDEILKFRREPSNKYDPNAIKVLTMKGVQIGFIRAENAATLAPQMDRGDILFGQVKSISGEGKKYLGVNMIVYSGGRVDDQN